MAARVRSLNDLEIPFSKDSLLFAPLIALCLTAAPAGPLGVVKDGNSEVHRILESADASVEKLAARADEFVDFVELAKRAMGKEWAKLSKKQQDEFTQTMKGLLRASYAQKALGDGKGGASTEYGGEKITGNEAIVSTTLVMKKDRFPVEYRLFRVDAKSPWKIYDVVTDAVSLVATYQDQFRQLISKKGYDGLLTTLKAKRDQLEKNQVSPTAAVGTAK
jgi:phospholipid transport system substrate-binding protein